MSEETTRKFAYVTFPLDFFDRPSFLKLRQKFVRAVEWWMFLACYAKEAKADGAILAEEVPLTPEDLAALSRTGTEEEWQAFVSECVRLKLLILSEDDADGRTLRIARPQEWVAPPSRLNQSDYSKGYRAGLDAKQKPNNHANENGRRNASKSEEPRRNKFDTSQAKPSQSDPSQSDPSQDDPIHPPSGEVPEGGPAPGAGGGLSPEVPGPDLAAGWLAAMVQLGWRVDNRTERTIRQELPRLFDVATFSELRAACREATRQTAFKAENEQGIKSPAGLAVSLLSEHLAAVRLQQVNNQREVERRGWTVAMGQKWCKPYHWQPESGWSTPATLNADYYLANTPIAAGPDELPEQPRAGPAESTGFPPDPVSAMAALAQSKSMAASDAA